MVVHRAGAGFRPEAGKLNVSTIGAPNPPLHLHDEEGRRRGPSSALGSTAAKDLQADLQAADLLYNAQKYDEAIAAYRAIMAKAPALSVINLQIAAAYRNKKEYDNAIAAYNDLLKADPNNDKAIVGIGMTNLEKGDLKAAEDTLTKAAQGPKPTREVFYNLGEVKFAKGQTDEAATWYQKAVGPRSVVGQADLQAGARPAEQGRQGRDDQDARESDQRRSDVAGSRAGQDGHRTAEEVTDKG